MYYVCMLGGNSFICKIFIRTFKFIFSTIVYYYIHISEMNAFILLLEPSRECKGASHRKKFNHSVAIKFFPGDKNKLALVGIWKRKLQFYLGSETEMGKMGAICAKQSAPNTYSTDIGCNLYNEPNQRVVEKMQQFSPQTLSI